MDFVLNVPRGSHVAGSVLDDSVPNIKYYWAVVEPVRGGAWWRKVTS